VFTEQLRRISLRWPRIGRELGSIPYPAGRIRLRDEGSTTLVLDGIQLSGAHNRHDEALLQASLVPGTARRATVYGLGMGDLPRVLLGREQVESLRVVLFNLEVVRAVLEHVDLGDWIDDPRVELVLASSLGAVETPFAASPGSLRLASDSAAPLRDLVQLELATPFIRKNAGKKAALLDAQVAANRERIEQDEDVRALFGSQPGARIHVAAAGPSLAESFDRLRERPAAEPLLAVDACLRSLLDAGVVPDMVLAIDPARHGILPYFQGDLRSCRESRLVYAPAVHADVLTTWTGTRSVAYTTEGCYQQLARELPRGRLFVSGTVTHCAVDLAVRMGASEVVLHGADFSFPRGLSHVEGAAHSRRMDAWRERGVWVLNAAGERVPTLPNLRGYLRDLEGFLQQHPTVRFVQASGEGARIRGAELEEAHGTRG